VNNLQKNTGLFIVTCMLAISNLNAQTIVKNGQFLFLKNYDSCSHFIVNDSLLFINNKKTNNIDIFNLYQKKFISNLNYQIATINYFFEFNTYARKTDPPYTPSSGSSHNQTNAVYFLQDSSSIYFLTIQNSIEYFVKLDKLTYKEVWKFRINTSGRVAYTMSNNKIVFFTEQAIFKTVNSNVDIPVSPGLVVYNTDGFLLKTFKVDIGRQILNPFFIQKKDTLLLGFGTYGNTISTDSFKLAPIVGTTNVALGSNRIIANQAGKLVSLWTNVVTNGKPYSSDTSILDVTYTWNGLSNPALNSTDYYLKAKKIGTAFLLYSYADLNGNNITTSIPITVANKETNQPFTPDFCLLSFDNNFNYKGNKFFTAQVQGGYYDYKKDSIFLYGTTSLLGGCCTYNGMKLNDSISLLNKGFNYILSFKDLKSYNYSLTRFDKYYSQGFGSTIFFDINSDNQMFYMPFKGSILFNKPYTSLSGTQYYSGDNFIVGFMDKNNPSIIDDSKTILFNSLGDVSAGLIKSNNTYFLTTGSNNFFSDKKYVDTGLYILSYSKDKVIDPDSLKMYNNYCAPPIVKNYSFCNNQSAIQLSVTINSTSKALWYGVNAIGGTFTTTAPIPSTQNLGTTTYYVSQKDSLLGCESARTKIDVIINAVPVAPIISRDTANYIISSVKNSITWYKEGAALADTSQKFKPPSPGSYTARTTQNGCASALSNPYYYLVTDVINLSADEFIKLAPNPFINQLNFDFVVKGYQRLNIEVFDIANGIKKVSMQNLTPGMPINLSQLSGGTYFIKVSSNDGKINYQFKMIKL